MTVTLNYPTGEFTQAELAAFNGMEKLVVYLPMKEAVEKGILVKTGTRPTGKRPANLYRVADSNAPVPPPVPVPTQPIVETPLLPQTASVVNPAPSPTNPPYAVIIANALKSALAPELAPVPQPVVYSDPNPAYPCPLCKGPMTEIPDATGVIVKCYNPCDPLCHENVFGHGKNSRDAFEVACQKFHT